MAKKNLYQIYKYELHKIDNSGDLFPEDTPLCQVQKKFYDLISGDNPLHIKRKGRGNEKVDLENTVEIKCEDVIVLMLCNERAYTVTERKQSERRHDHPGCYIIIDNRENVAQIAVEQHSAFEGDCDKVCLLIQDAMNSLLFPYGIEINISAKNLPVNIWEMVDEHTRAGEFVKRMSFHFSSPKETAGIDAPQHILDYLAFIHSLQRAMGETVGELNFCASGTKGLRMEQTNRDLVEMVHLCQNNAYDLEVEFSEYGVYRSGTEEKARYALDSEIVTNFIEGVKVLDENNKFCYELVNWLDQRRIAYENYEDRPVKPARKGRA